MSTIAEDLYTALRRLRADYIELCEDTKRDPNDSHAFKSTLKAMSAFEIDDRPLPVEPVARKGDMGEGLKLQLLRDGDGDIIVSVLPDKHKFGDMALEFCVPGTGGGKSPETFAALQALMRGMEEDERKDPHRVVG